MLEFEITGLDLSIITTNGKRLLRDQIKQTLVETTTLESSDIASVAFKAAQRTGLEKGQMKCCKRKVASGCECMSDKDGYCSPICDDYLPESVGGNAGLETQGASGGGGGRLRRDPGVSEWGRSGRELAGANKLSMAEMVTIVDVTLVDPLPDTEAQTVEVDFSRARTESTPKFNWEVELWNVASTETLTPKVGTNKG